MRRFFFSIRSPLSSKWLLLELVAICICRYSHKHYAKLSIVRSITKEICCLSLEFGLGFPISCRATDKTAFKPNYFSTMMRLFGLRGSGIIPGLGVVRCYSRRGLRNILSVAKLHDRRGNRLDRVVQKLLLKGSPTIALRASKKVMLLRLLWLSRQQGGRLTVSIG